MINGVLVEKTVKEVTPALQTNSEGLKKVLEELVKQYKRQQEDMENWKVSPFDLASSATDMTGVQYLSRAWYIVQRVNADRSSCNAEEKQHPGRAAMTCLYTRSQPERHHCHLQHQLGMPCLGLFNKILPVTLDICTMVKSQHHGTASGLYD